jgi:hypothetical protein
MMGYGRAMTGLFHTEALLKRVQILEYFGALG